MALVHLLTTAVDDAQRPFARAEFERVVAASRVDRFGVHHVIDDAEAADVILFVGSAYADLRDVRAHPLVKRHREKAFLYDSSDRVIPFLPGVYACTERRWYSSQRTRTGFYLRVAENESLVPRPMPEDAALFSFVGKIANAPVRRQFAKLQGGVIVDSTSGQTDAEESFADVMRRSRFVLCPRGLGTSTWRLFEAMKCGRAPVILSDAWVPPVGPRWEEFSIRVREGDVRGVPSLLALRAHDAERMGRIAREEWEAWFSREVAFHRIVEWCLDIAHTRRLPERLLRVRAYAELARPFFFRHYVLSRLKK